jgi:hypothetical protein
MPRTEREEKAERIESAKRAYQEGLQFLDRPDNPAPYLRYIEGVLATFGEEADELVTYDSFVEDMMKQGLAEDYAEYAWYVLKNRPYEIRVVWL